MERIKGVWFPMMRGIEFIGVIAAITVVIVDFVFDRPEDRIIRAWGVIAQSNIGQGNIGQIAALKTLKNAGEDVRGINLNSAWLYKADLSELDLSRVDFKHAKLKGANFTNATLLGADFRAADVTDVDFRGANLDGAKFTEYPTGKTNVSGADFSNAINVPDLSQTCAAPNIPPTHIPDGVLVPDQWMICEEPKF